MICSRDKYTRLLVVMSVVISTLVPLVVVAANESANPLSSPTLMAVVRAFVNTVVYVVTPVLILAFVYGGFLMVVAQGNPNKLNEAKSFLFTVTWVSMLFWGIWIIVALVVGTLSALTAGGLLLILGAFLVYAILRK